MHNNKKNEELQSRREFFKKAAKGALPILGAIALANVPNLAQAVNTQSTYCVAGAACTGGCSGSCKGTCKLDVLDVLEAVKEHVIIPAVSKNLCVFTTIGINSRWLIEI